MRTLVLGASGATGRKLVEQLLNKGQKVKVIVRAPEKLPGSWKDNKRVSIIKAEIASMTEGEMRQHVKDCRAVASCLGHNISLKGVYGKPRKLVRNAVRLLCQSIQKNAPDKPIKFVLLNTAGNRNRDLQEAVSFREKLAIAAIRLLLPPQSDNEKAAEHLRVEVGQNDPSMEWVIVRPDRLTDENRMTDYKLSASPIRSAVFNAGETSRINVGHFMARLITDNNVWNEWKGQMPVIYNAET